MLYIDLIVGAVTIVLYPESDRTHQFIILYQLYITNSMNFFAPADNFICAVGIHIFNKVR